MRDKHMKLDETVSKFFQGIADDKRNNSLSAKFRKKRFKLFKCLFDSVPKPSRIIDVGGTKVIWEKEGFGGREDVEIVIINNHQFQTNPQEEQSVYSNIVSVFGDATNMKQFKDQEFDIVYSNSVIEHVGEREAQRQMANEVMRVGKRYFLQTPNFNFPIEPHFMFPGFQFLPFWFRLWLITHFSIGCCGRINDEQEAINFLSSFKLLSQKEMIEFFPHSNLYKEKILGLTKSFIAYDGWEINLNKV
jgi:hypothetical protein